MTPFVTNGFKCTVAIFSDLQEYWLEFAGKLGCIKRFVL
jgi:hypothetical protein